MRPRTGQAVLEHEMREEQAATMGRLSRELQACLETLKGFDKRPSTATMAADRRHRKRADLVEAAAHALWCFVVQLECSGFRTVNRLLEEYAVPTEVCVKMGAMQPR